MATTSLSSLGIASEIWGLWGPLPLPFAWSLVGAGGVIFNGFSGKEDNLLDLARRGLESIIFCNSASNLAIGEQSVAEKVVHSLS